MKCEKQQTPFAVFSVDVEKATISKFGGWFTYPPFHPPTPLMDNLRGKALIDMPSVYIRWMVFRFPPFPSTFFYSKSS
jgi:hypothetical protein